VQKRERQEVIFRVSKTDYAKAKLKLIEEHLTLQKLMEVLFSEWLKDNKSIKECIKPYANAVYDKKRKELDPLELDEIRRLLDEEISPLRDQTIRSIVKEHLNEE
jgi:hypothetical protein